MQRCIQRSLRLAQKRYLSTKPLPWFIDQPSDNVVRPESSGEVEKRPPLPEDTPNLLRELHRQLLQSPHLDASTLTVSQSISPPPGPLLPVRPPQGRRRRGATYAQEYMYDMSGGGLWDWMLMAQVKEGSENRGGIESVVRVVRKTLSTIEPGLELGGRSKRRVHNGWAMIDGGSFAVHILSKEVKEKYFSGWIM